MTATPVAEYRPGYEYQNRDGHCLFNDGGTLEVGGACQATDDEEQFFGIAYYSGTGWQWGVTADKTSFLVNATGGPAVHSVRR